MPKYFESLIIIKISFDKLLYMTHFYIVYLFYKIKKVKIIYLTLLINFAEVIYF